MGEPYREPGRDMDVTEIERAKVHERAETEREKIKQREETKRKRLSEQGPAWPLAIAAVLLASIAGGTCVMHRREEAKLEATEAGRPKPCIDSAVIIDSDSRLRECPGGRIESEKLSEGKALIRCRCAATPAEVKP